MKFFSDPTYSLRFRASRQNLRLLGFLVILTVTLVLVYSAIFLILMSDEGKEYSWISAVYWTTTNMSTLGLGDIAFLSDSGRAFTVIVHLSGLMILLVFIPFLFVQLFQSAARVPRELPPGTRRHIVLTHYDPITNSLIKRLTRYRYPYTLIIEDLAEALELYDQGIRVMVGNLHTAETFSHARVTRAALVACTAPDKVNVNTAYTIREVSGTVPLLTTGHGTTSVEVLASAGSSHVLELPELMGQALARRVLAGDALAHVVGQVDDLLIAEAMVAGTPLEGKTLAEANVEKLFGRMITGVLNHGEFSAIGPETTFSADSVLLLAGDQTQIDAYNELFCIYHVSDAPVIIIGGGRVGRATGRALRQRNITYRFVESRSDRITDGSDVVIGDALDPDVLKKAGVMDASTVLITSPDDDTNIFLATYLRRLREDIPISSRATQEENVRSLHHAGADFVLSYATMGANAIFNYLRRGNVLMVTEGLNVFKVPVPAKRAGTSIAASEVQQRSGCSIIAVKDASGIHVNPDPAMVLEKGSELILIGTGEAEETLIRTFAAS